MGQLAPPAGVGGWQAGGSGCGHSLGLCHAVHWRQTSPSRDPTCGNLISALKASRFHRGRVQDGKTCADTAQPNTCKGALCPGLLMRLKPSAREDAFLGYCHSARHGPRLRCLTRNLVCKRKWMPLFLSA